MEDLAASFRFPSPRHRWTEEESGPMMNAYAMLHHAGESCLPPPDARAWLVDRHEARLEATAGELPAMAQEVARRGMWPELPGLARLVEQNLATGRQLADGPVTVLHNDVYPPNIGFAHQPLESRPRAVLLDWDMVGWGLAEMDLAFMFLQPYRSHCLLDRTAALEVYWRQRAKLAGFTFDPAARKARQDYADALWALWLVPVAFRMATSPFPPGSGPRVYWESMFSILGERLEALCRDV
jgi:hypothetical protein